MQDGEDTFGHIKGLHIQGGLVMLSSLHWLFECYIPHVFCHLAFNVFLHFISYLTIAVNDTTFSNTNSNEAYVAFVRSSSHRSSHHPHRQPMHLG